MRYSGKKVEVSQAKELLLRNATEKCTIKIKPCTPHEGSRIDGTCNNYNYPTRGSARGPYLRLLKPDYGNNHGIRMNRHGEPLPSARKVRTELQTTGRVEDRHKYNAAAIHMLKFVHRDISIMNGPLDYLRHRQYCCTEIGQSDPRCIPINVPEDDPYLKVTNIRCLNFSRAETFQDANCSPDIILPEQINFQTPVIDLSTIYGVDEEALHGVRKYEYGLLIMEKRQNRYVPKNITRNQLNLTSNNLLDTKNNLVSKIDTADDTIRNTAPNMLPNLTQNINTNQDVINMTADMLAEMLANIATNPVVNTSSDAISNLGTNTTENICFQNNDTETICYQFGFPEVGNFDLRTTALTIFFMREHNRIARALHHMNPCWRDDRLFKVARQINIATVSNIFMYELLPAFLGLRNMINYELISEQVEHVSAYAADAIPLVYAEYEIANRFFHTLLDGRIKMFKEDYRYKDEYPYSDTLFRSGILEKGKILEEITRGIFQQNAAKLDNIQDPEISENFFGKHLQKAHDLAAIDIQRGRDMGVRGYNDYRHMCGIKPAQKFEDFFDTMEVEKVEALKKLYDEVDDVDLLAGIMCENNIQGMDVGPTLFCIMTKQLQLFRFSDRFWFERGDQMHSFSLGQLHEIRKTNMARLACDNADGIKYVQPQAFMNVKPGNMPVPCNHIEGADLTKWRDDSCYRNKHSHEATHGPMRHKDKHYRKTSMFYGNGRHATKGSSNFFDNVWYNKPSEIYNFHESTRDIFENAS
ncbi:unnamed protein product [Arctia plantaginis]|uniref:Peroxidase n=1 Tax=Arctia plantaginis TaxID=874455 RepID=A0A8S0ZRK7_ARCPL|nr:unnamed protein product [Arctia plantaginis]